MRYSVEFEARAFYQVVVEAEDREEAAEKAAEYLPPVIGICCDGYGKPNRLAIADDPACWEEVGVQESETP